MSLHEDVVRWARDNRAFLQNFGSDGDRRNYLRVVSRVYLAGTLNVSLQSTRNVGLTASGGVPKPVPLDTIKQMSKLKDMVLVKNSRLSVQPVSLPEWREVCRMGGLDPKKLER